jgi:hypothetical protein
MCCIRKPPLYTYRSRLCVSGFSNLEIVWMYQKNVMSVILTCSTTLYNVPQFQCINISFTYNAGTEAVPLSSVYCHKHVGNHYKWDPDMNG